MATDVVEEVCMAFVDDMATEDLFHAEESCMSVSLFEDDNIPSSLESGVHPAIKALSAIAVRAGLRMLVME